MTAAVIKLALLAGLACTEIAWWEGRWADRGVACDASTGDRSMHLSPTLLDLGEPNASPSTSRQPGLGDSG